MKVEILRISSIQFCRAVSGRYLIKNKSARICTAILHFPLSILNSRSSFLFTTISQLSRSRKHNRVVFRVTELAERSRFYQTGAAGSQLAGNVAQRSELDNYFKLVTKLLNLITKRCIIRSFGAGYALWKDLMPMNRWVALAAAAVLCACALMPNASYTEDVDTVRLARTIYALARSDSYDAKLAIGTLAMNRVESPWFGDTLGEVLDEQHQFPMGSRYDADSLAAAHAVLAGRRTLDPAAVYYQSQTATERRKDAPLQKVGTFAFYATETVI